jgi:hypothetical protein
MKTKKRHGLIIDGGKPILFETKEARQEIIDNIHNRMTYSTFEKGLLNPNCSEIIARLPVNTLPEGKKLLKSVGLEIIRFDPYIDMHVNMKIPMMEKGNYIIDPENPNLPDFKFHSRLTIERADFERDEGIYVVGHQHSQPQLYPTIKKISDKIGVEFKGYDGGYDFEECFEDWINKGQPKTDHQDEIRKSVKKLLRIPEIKNLAKNVFYAIDYIESKDLSEAQKYKMLIEEYKKYCEKNKKKIIKETKDNEEYKNILKGMEDEKIFEEAVKRDIDKNVSSLFHILNDKKIRKFFLDLEEIFNYE